MRKRKKGRKLKRKKGQRRALLNSLGESLILKERIKTTEAKAKEISSFIEKNITEAKKSNLSARKRISKNFSDTATKKIINEIAPRYKEREGGYTRILKLGPRKSDGAKIAIIEFVK